MKKNTNIRKTPVKSLLTKATALITVFCFAYLGCKQESDKNLDLRTGAKSAATTSAQPLPGGKARFSVAVGNLDASGNSFVRIVNMTFDSAAGTVGATAYEWISDQKKGISAVNTHRCTFDGVTQMCTVYSPTGWLAGGSSNPYKSWTGTYTYSGGVLGITWTSGKTGSESWTITNPTSTIARAVLSSSSTAMGYTHGRGYGSNASWSTFKTIDQMKPFPTYSSTYSRRAMAASNSGVMSTSPATYSFNTWTSAGMNLSGFTSPSLPTNPTNAAHYWDQATTVCNTNMCNANARPGVSGIIYHFASTNTSRAIAYTNYCACLATNTDWPCYGGNLHPSAFMQVIDDNGALVGLVGIEAQNPVSSSYNGNYQFHVWDFNNIP